MEGVSGLKTLGLLMSLKAKKIGRKEEAKGVAVIQRRSAGTAGHIGIGGHIC